LTTLLPIKVMAKAKIRNSIISPGCVIEGEIYDSVLSPGVHVKSGARIEKSVVMNNAIIGEGSEVSHAILDKNTRIGEQCRIGFGELIPNKETPHLLSCGITVIGKNAVLPDHFTAGKNCLIYPDIRESDYQKDEISSGDTVKPLWGNQKVPGGAINNNKGERK
ncbi:hypothetical protein JW926_02985, partial [Candidatus Sumerlaeota bacterium]|nr:hypothetical protein [Candidatus Sumerlaeota bacterium]